MESNRMEAFSDGVLAIIITIMVLEIKAPESYNINALLEILPMFLGYLLSFLYVAIYWNNHHYLLKCIDKLNTKILWANMNFLFWISLIPFTTAWLSKYYNESVPVLIYGIVLLLTAISYFILQELIINCSKYKGILKNAIGKDYKGKISSLLYITASIFALYFPFLSKLIYFLVAIIWIIPDKRLEKAIKNISENK